MYFDYDLFLQDLGSWVLVSFITFTLLFILGSLCCYSEYRKDKLEKTEWKKDYSNYMKYIVFTKQNTCFLLIFSSAYGMYEANLIISRIIFALAFLGFFLLAIKHEK